MKNVYSIHAIIIALFFFHTCGFAQMQSDTSDAYWEVVIPLSASQDVDM